MTPVGVVTSRTLRLGVLVACFVLGGVLPAGALAQEDAADGGAAEPAETYSVARYRELEDTLGELDIARVATEPGTEERVAATEAAIQHRRRLINYISGWLADGSLPEGAHEQAEDARLILVENIVHLSVEIGRCADARTSLGTIEEFGRSSDPARQRAYESASAAVVGCEPAEPSAADVAPVSPPSPVVTPAPPDPITPPAPIVIHRLSPRQRAGVALIGVGGAAAIAGAAWNLASLDERAAYLDDRRACERSGESCDAAQSARRSLHSAKAPIGVLVAGGLATAGVGALLYFVSPNDRTPAVNAWYDGESAGLVLRVGAWR